MKNHGMKIVLLYKPDGAVKQYKDVTDVIIGIGIQFTSAAHEIIKSNLPYVVIEAQGVKDGSAPAGIP
jgi:hypothetical protein